MSPASYLTAPPRDAASILALSGRGGMVVTMAAMSLLAWVSLLFLLLALLGPVTVAVVRGLRMWRAFRAFSGAASSRVDAGMQTAAGAERAAGSLTAKTQPWTAAVAPLPESPRRLPL